MKSIYLIRHAQAGFGILDFSDLDRPLNKKGHIEALHMSKYFAKNIEKSIDIFVSSPANRAISTAKYFSNALELGEGSINISKNLYLPSTLQLWETIQSLDNQKIHSACIVSHNVGISDFATSIFNSTIQFYEIPTCGIVKIVFDSNTWEDCNKDNSIIENHWFPSLILEPSLYQQA